MRSFTVAFLSLCLVATHGFAPLPTGAKTSSTSLNLFEQEKHAVASVLATAVLAATVVTATPAIAAQPDFGPSQQLLAGRSGGRAGGRAGGGSYSRSSYSAPRAAPRTTYRSSTTIVRPMIAAPPVVVSPFGGGYGYGYGNPMGGFGLGYGLGAINNSGNAMRDYRQESEIQRSQAELEVAKEKEKDLEARIKALEAQGQAVPAAAIAPAQQVAPVAK